MAQLRTWQQELRTLIVTLPATEAAQVLAVLDAAARLLVYGHSQN